MRWATSIAICVGLLGAAAAAAHAGVYEVRSCGTTGDLAAFAPTTPIPTGLSTSTQCPAVPGRRISGLVVASTGLNAERGARAAWTIAAPGGTSLQRLDVQRAFQKWDTDWNVAIRTAEGGTLETCEIGGAQVSCGRGLDAGTQAISYTDLNTSAVTFGVECRGTHECAGWTSPVQAWVAVYSATALVEDPAPPTLAPLGGTLASGWHSGTERVDVGASDASGVRSLSVFAGTTKLFERLQTCDYTRMQPCPAEVRESVAIDPSRLADGTYGLEAVATDAADQAGTAKAVLKVDRHPPEAPRDLVVERNPDGTMAFAWRNPDQGPAAPVVAAHYEICDNAGAGCVEAAETGSGIARLGSVAIAGGPHVVRVWLQDEAGNADRANAATLAIDPSTVRAPRVIDLNPPVLDPGPDAPALRLRSARRRGATLTLTGTIARAATARITANASRGRTSSPLASARTSPRRGRWTVRLKLTSTLRHSSTFYVSVSFAGQRTFSASTIRRRLARKPARSGGASEEFSLEARSGR